MNRIKQVRIARGETIQQIADDIGISVEDMIAIENMSIEELRQCFLPPIRFDELFG